ncbi:MAG: UvrD-helicase domain-containing protein [Chloroflexi bacterium]|nr:UvrD-helicase domain-containing protein [Chloroflexota bacterium]
MVARQGDVVVTAGAGTGKTRTLVARYLSLLAELPLRHIVAITFTDKAAREMRNRVRQELDRLLYQVEMDEPERHLWQERLAALDSARISTIHSLCGEILRTHPASAGLDPRFTVLAEGDTLLLKAQAVEWALAEAARQERLTPLFTFWGEPAWPTSCWLC